QAVETAPGKRTAEQTALLKKFPTVREVKFVAGFLVEYDPKAHAAFEKERAEVAKLRATKPPVERVMAVLGGSGGKNESRLFFRGDPEQPKQPVRPGELAILTRDRPGPDLAGTTGRRLAYARWLTDG